MERQRMPFVDQGFRVSLKWRVKGPSLQDYSLRRIGPDPLQFAMLATAKVQLKKWVCDRQEQVETPSALAH